MSATDLRSRLLTAEAAKAEVEQLIAAVSTPSKATESLARKLDLICARIAGLKACLVASTGGKQGHTQAAAGRPTGDEAKDTDSACPDQSSTPHTDFATPVIGPLAVPRGRVSSDVRQLQALHTHHPWVPGHDHIRPVPAHVHQKVQFLETIEKRFDTHADYVFAELFGLPTTCPYAEPHDAICVVSQLHRNMAARRRMCVLVANMFPYQVPHNSHHAVMWYASSAEEVDDGDVDADIEERLPALALAEGVTSTPDVPAHRFDFVWYLNPKMSIPGVYHVQVFWRLRPRCIDSGRTQ